MAITSSAKKAVKRSKFLQERNLVFKSAMKKAIKTIRKAITDGKKDAEIMPLLTAAYSAIDKAQRRNIIHKNNAARKKSRLATAVKKTTTK